MAWQYLLDYGQAVTARKNESELWIELPNGSRVTIYGADNADALRGLYLDGCILDEYADMKPSVWSSIIRPMLADRKGWCVWIGTPKGHNEFYQIYQRSLDEPGWYSLRLRASTSGILDPDELADARKAMSEDQYNQEFETSFEAAIQGAVYGRWMREADEEGRILPQIDYDDEYPVHTAWDLGFDDATAIWWWQAGYNEVRLIDYYEASGEPISHYCDVIKSKNYKYGMHYVPHDAAQKLLAAGGRSIVMQMMQDHGIIAQVVPATSQQNGIEALRKTLEVCWFDREKCAPGIEALRQYRFEYDEERKTYRSKPLDDWSSHGCDAAEIIGQVWRNHEYKVIRPKGDLILKDMVDEHFRKQRARRSEEG